MVKIRPTMEDNDRLSLADVAIIQLSIYDGGIPFVRNGPIGREIRVHVISP